MFEIMKDAKPLLDAAYEGHLEAVKYLVRVGLDVRVCYGRGLSLGATGGHFEVVKYLKEQMKNV